MCGIFGVITSDTNAVERALHGIGSLDHRGDDSIGIAFLDQRNITRCVLSKETLENEILFDGYNDSPPNKNDLYNLIYYSEEDANYIINENRKPQDLKDSESAKRNVKEFNKKIIESSCAIVHTRWATIGHPNDNNSHPHCDISKDFYLVHNGNVENLNAVKKILNDKKDIKDEDFYSKTDTEVIANLIAFFYEDSNDIVKSIQLTMQELVGSNVILVMSKNDQKRLYVAKKGGTVILVKNTNSVYIASDPLAFGNKGDKVYLLKHNEVAVVDHENWNIIQKVEQSFQDDDYYAKPTKGGYEHFMLKEIIEQDWRLKQSLSGRIDYDQGISRLGGIDSIGSRRLRMVKTFHFIGCGTAYNSCLYAQLIFNRFGISARAWIASEFIDNHPVFDPDDAFVFVSQSGETHDTMEVVREIIIKGNIRLGVINVPDSLIWRNMDAGIGIRAGQEKGVASTKAFTLQLSGIVLLAVFLARQRNMTVDTGRRILHELDSISEKISTVLSQRDKIKDLAKKYSTFKNCYFLGRYFNYVTAEEGSLKLKEISYIHSEAYPLGEMKHGPLALIDKDFLSIVIIPNDTVFEKGLVNIEELKSRYGNVIALTDNESIVKNADDVIYVPPTFDYLSPILYSVPLQIFSYYMAKELGYNPDKPRNLAKVVTVG